LERRRMPSVSTQLRCGFLVFPVCCSRIYRSMFPVCLEFLLLPCGFHHRSLTTQVNTGRNPFEWDEQRLDLTLSLRSVQGETFSWQNSVFL